MTTRANTTSRRGFTLVELLVASLVTAIVAGSATFAVGGLLRLKTRSHERAQASSRADAAAQRISQDVLAAVRHSELAFAKVRVQPSLSAQGPAADDLLLITRSLRPVRGGGDVRAEGGEFSVQYRLMPRSAEDSKLALWRRSNTAIYPIPDSGGIAAPVVSGVASLRVEAFDGQQWFASWDSDSDGLPHALRVTVVGESDSGRSTSVARRVVALDRVPPPVAPADETTGTSATPSTDTGTTGSSGTSGSGGGGR